MFLYFSNAVFLSFEPSFNIKASQVSDLDFISYISMLAEHIGTQKAIFLADYKGNQTVHG